MSNEPENLTLRYLRRLDATLNRVGGKLDEVVRRLRTLERTVAPHGMEVAWRCAHTTGFERRPERIERRLDLVEGHS